MLNDKLRLYLNETTRIILWTTMLCTVYSVLSLFSPVWVFPITLPFAWTPPCRHSTSIEHYIIPATCSILPIAPTPHCEYTAHAFILWIYLCEAAIQFLGHNAPKQRLGPATFHFPFKGAVLYSFFFNCSLGSLQEVSEVYILKTPKSSFCSVCVCRSFSPLWRTGCFVGVGMYGNELCSDWPPH